MKKFNCSKCNSTEVFIEQNGNNIGLYCADCGKWIKWLNKDELRLAERQIKEYDKEIRAKAIDEMLEELQEVIDEHGERYVMMYMKERAKQLKAGGIDG